MTQRRAFVEFRRPRPEDYEAISALIQAEWPARGVDAVRVGRWIAKSSDAVVAEARGQVVGFVRVISDDTSSAYIPMLIVQESWRGQGVGRALVEHVTGGFANPEITWVLRARVGSEPFWTKVGFRMSSRAMERTRTRG